MQNPSVVLIFRYADDHDETEWEARIEKVNGPCSLCEKPIFDHDYSFFVSHPPTSDGRGPGMDRLHKTCMKQLLYDCNVELISIDIE